LVDAVIKQPVSGTSVSEQAINKTLTGHMLRGSQQPLVTVIDFMRTCLMQVDFNTENAETPLINCLSIVIALLQEDLSLWGQLLSNRGLEAISALVASLAAAGKLGAGVIHLVTRVLSLNTSWNSDHVAVAVSTANRIGTQADSQAGVDFSLVIAWTTLTSTMVGAITPNNVSRTEMASAIVAPLACVLGCLASSGQFTVAAEAAATSMMQLAAMERPGDKSFTSDTAKPSLIACLRVLVACASSDPPRISLLLCCKVVVSLLRVAQEITVTAVTQGYTLDQTIKIIWAALQSSDSELERSGMTILVMVADQPGMRVACFSRQESLGTLTAAVVRHIDEEKFVRSVCALLKNAITIAAPRQFKSRFMEGTNKDEFQRFVLAIRAKYGNQPHEDLLALPEWVVTEMNRVHATA
jgi:hypothetical protein